MSYSTSYEDHKETIAMDYPKLRHGLELSPIEHQGQSMIMIRDRMGYSESTLLFAPQVALLLMHMNGKNSLRDLQAQYMRRTNELVYMEQLQEITRMLDEHLFLETERFMLTAAKELNRYKQDPIRRMHLAGKSYPKEPQVLRDFLGSLFLDIGGLTISGERPNRQLQILGLVAPHIDIQAGGACFAHAYKALFQASSADTWVILGTGHEPVENYFAVTPKDFETPLGLIHCDKDYCEELIRLAPRDICASEYNHRREHVVEFQAVFLSYVQPDALIVPILCSFSPEDWRSDASFIDEVARLLLDLAGRGSSRRVGFLASVDLAHVGPRYGDRITPNQGTIAEHIAADNELLELLSQGNADGFLKKIDREHNRRKICGVAPLYILAKIMEGRAHGVVLDHAHATVDSHNSFVTFASMAFYGDSGVP